MTHDEKRKQASERHGWNQRQGSLAAPEPTGRTPPLREIAGTDANTEIQELAHCIAEAQIDLRRVRCARHQFLTRKLAEPYYDSRANTRAKAAVLGRLLRGNSPDVPPDALMNFLTSAPQGPQKFAIILAQETKQLLAMDRYERRALSRRNFAVRAFDETRRGEQLLVVTWAERSQNSQCFQGGGAPRARPVPPRESL